MKNSLIKSLRKQGGIIIKPNPIIQNFNLFKLGKTVNRYHQKVKLIDDDIFIGSININNDYTGSKYGYFKYIDISLFLHKSPCVNKVIQFFMNIVNKNINFLRKNEQDNIIKINNKLNATINKYINNNKSEYFLEESPPNKFEISESIANILNNAKDTITIVQSYYLNIQHIEEILLRALKRGVKLEIITAAKRDQLCYRFLYNDILFEKLLENGANIYEFLDKSFHMKCYYIDKKIINIGSFNHDIVSFYCNNEANYLIYKTPSNEYFFNDFDNVVNKIKDNCHIVKYRQTTGIKRYWGLLVLNIVKCGFFLFQKGISLTSK